MNDGFRYALDAAVGHFLPQEFARKPASGQLGFDFEEDHPREKSSHDGKKPGEFSPKAETTAPTTVDKQEPPADTTPVAPDGGAEESLAGGSKMSTLTIKGSTVRAAAKLKEMGFVFNPSTKSWSLDAERGQSKYGQDGFVDKNGNFIGSEESILHSVKTHAKAHDLIITVSDGEPQKPAMKAESPESPVQPVSTEGERKFTKRRGTRDQAWQVGGTVRAPDGTVHIITSVHRPYFDDERSDYIHGVTTRPATAEEAASSSRATEISRLRKFLDTRKHGPDDDRDRDAYDQVTREARQKLAELEAAK